MHHPYRFIQPEQLWQSSASSARSEQVEGSLAFLLSGAHIGYLPQHIAAPREARGLLRALAPEQLGFRVQFHLASHRGHQPSEAQLAFIEDLLGVFG
ncbi:LysR substrate binding domain protein [compost metagenome]